MYLCRLAVVLRLWLISISTALTVDFPQRLQKRQNIFTIKLFVSALANPRTYTNNLPIAFPSIRREICVRMETGKMASATDEHCIWRTNHVHQ